MLLLKYVEMQEKAHKTATLLPDQVQKKDEFLQFTTMQLNFVLNGYLLKILR